MNLQREWTWCHAHNQISPEGVLFWDTASKTHLSGFLSQEHPEWEPVVLLLLLFSWVLK